MSWLSEQLNEEWSMRLADVLEESEMKALAVWLSQRYDEAKIYPARDRLFFALNSTTYNEVKVVLLGQDPYHGEGQACGMSFSVQRGVKLPPSLRNIFKELESDVGCRPPQHGSLENWARQGVVLLNTVLTVEEGKPGSHQGKGWERFTDQVIEALNEREKPMVFLLWGKHAQEKRGAIDESKHLVIASAHPSPFAARKGFFGSKPFSRANDFLIASGEEPVDWEIPE